MPTMNSLEGEAIAAARAVGSVVGATRNIPWLEFEMQSGRQFEVVPAKHDLAGVEVFRVEVNEVSEFRTPRKWPGGPLETKSDATFLSVFLLKPIASANIDSGNSESSACVTIRFWGGSGFRIEHDPSLPMSLRFENVPNSAA